MRSTWVMTTLLLVLGCSAGGASDGGATVSPGAPGTLPASGTNAGNSLMPATGAGSEFFAPDEVEPTDECDGTIPITLRDFSEAHPDFEMDFRGDVVRRQLISADLGPGDKPVFADSVGCPAQQGTPTACANWSVQQPVIASATTFDQWYRSVDGVNITFERELELTESPPGSGFYTYSSTQFFPLEPNEGFGVTPANQGRNFLFTTEIHLNFTYVAGQEFSFQGDDDLWIFVNKRLALDLGSLHNVESGTIDFDAQAAELGISPNGVYAMDIFHAERHTDASNFTIETNIACFTPVVVR